MFENLMNFLKKLKKREKNTTNSKDMAKERLHLVLMQDRANVSADFLDLMRQEIIDVIKKYIEVDESAIDVRLTNKENEDGTNGAPALYANIPIINIREDAKKDSMKKEEPTNQSEKIAEVALNDALGNGIPESNEEKQNENDDKDNNTEIKDSEENKDELKDNSEAESIVNTSTIISDQEITPTEDANIVETVEETKTDNNVENKIEQSQTENAN